MARHLRVEFPGAIYHVACRMIGDDRLERSRLFVDDKDRARFLERLGERVEQYEVRLFLFVLMSNHFHLVFETPSANCSQFMQSLSTAYTVYYNLRHGRHGHLLDGRYKAKVVEGDDYLLALSRYVHLNPVQVGKWKDGTIEERVEKLRSYGWSSYPSYIGQGKPLDFVTYGPLLSQMAGPEREWPRRYREFVEAGLAESDKEFAVAKRLSPRSIGSEGFRAWIDQLHQQRTEKGVKREDVSFRRVTSLLPSGDVLAVLAEAFEVKVGEFSRRRHDSPLRGVAARFLIRYAGLNQRDVAGLLDAGSGSAVCKQLARLDEKLAADQHLRRKIERAEERLAKVRRDRPTSRGAPAL
jgi:putative transposase